MIKYWCRRVVFIGCLFLSPLILTGCNVGDLAVIKKDEIEKCHKPVVDGFYPFKLRASVVSVDSGLKIKVNNTHPDISVAVGAYAAYPKLALVNLQKDRIEWCAYDVVNVVGSNHIVTDEGYVGNTISTSELNAQIASNKIPNGSYHMRFRVVGTATNWCNLKVKEGRFYELSCGEDGVIND